MNYYEKLIQQATGCTDSDAAEIEDYMRHVIFHSTLSWQTRPQLIKAAKTAYNDILFMRSPEGIKMMSELESEMGL